MRALTDLTRDPDRTPNTIDVLASVRAWDSLVASTSMVLGVRSGSRVRSVSARMAGALGSRKCSGLKSKPTSGRIATLTASATTNAHRTLRRFRSSQRSTGASTARPASRCAWPAPSNRTSAGSSVTLSTRVTIIPAPAMIPNSAMPT